MILFHCCKTIHMSWNPQKIWHFSISLPSHSYAHDEGVASKNYSQPIAGICRGIPKTRGTRRKKVKRCVFTNRQNGEKRKKIQHESVAVTQRPLFFVVFSFTRAFLADLHHRRKKIFEKLTHWFIRINSLLLLKSEQNKKSCICLC